MLSPSSDQIVRATLPIIGAAIGDITPIFYKRLFAAHPELEQNLFNSANQAQGDQQRALAGAIAVYATLLVAEDGPDPREVLGRIAHKHASLGIVPEQYPVVHEHLFAAIVEVLGDAVTAEVAAAWDEVYWHMANTLIEIEHELYAEAGVTAEEVFRDVVLLKRSQESPDTVSFVVGAADGSALPSGRPGQYISVAVRMPDGRRQLRQYSLTGSEPGTWSFSVRGLYAAAATPAGEVSNHLHATVFEGDHFEASHPFGELELADGDGPLVLVSAGIGATPMLGILRHLRDTGSTRQVTILHADRTPARHAHRAELKALAAALPNASLVRWYEDLGSRPERTDLMEGLISLESVDLPADTDVYLCGPHPFMMAVNAALTARGVTEEHIHYETFGPARTLAVA